MRVLSCNVGAAHLLEGAKGMPSGIAKVAVPSLSVRNPGPKDGGNGSGAMGDFIGDRANHGGTDQALYAVGRGELDYWGAQLSRYLPDGHFGENLTIDGDVDAALLDEVWQVGTTVLQVSGPRVPCVTFATHMGERGWVKRFATHARPGAYLRVLQPGQIVPGDVVQVTSRPDHSIDVPTALRAFLGDRGAVAAVLETGAGGEAFRAELG